MKKQNSPPRKDILKNAFERFAVVAGNIASSTMAFVSALLIVIVWGATGPLFNFSNRWQLVINTGTSIVTFLMVFLIQKGQNKDTLALQIKLNELVSAHEMASNRIINIEDLTEEELRVLNKYYLRLAETARKEKQADKDNPPVKSE